jgi:hypothetical protein
VSNEHGRLLSVGDLVTGIKRLKADPSKILVAAISAPPTPYIVALGPSQKADPSQWPYVQHSCAASDGTYGDPAVRTKQWVDGFGSNGVFEEICNDSDAPALEAIAGKVAKVMGVPCLDPTVDPDTCTFVDSVVSSSGEITSVPLTRCTGAAGETSCWSFAASSLCPTSGSITFKHSSATRIVESSKGTCSIKGSP